MDARAMERVAAGGAVKTEEVLSRSDVKLGRGCGTHTFSLLLRTRSWQAARRALERVQAVHLPH